MNFYEVEVIAIKYLMAKGLRLIHILGLYINSFAIGRDLA
jgi:hypothetical protein